MATVAVLLVIGGCNMEPIPSAEVVAAGDIASCRTGGDEATAELVEGIDGTDGVLKLTLQPKSYEWEFVPVEGESFTDSGGAQCH